MTRENRFRDENFTLVELQKNNSLVQYVFFQYVSQMYNQSFSQYDDYSYSM